MQKFREEHFFDFSESNDVLPSTMRNIRALVTDLYERAEECEALAQELMETPDVRPIQVKHAPAPNSTRQANKALQHKKQASKEFEKSAAEKEKLKAQKKREEEQRKRLKKIQKEAEKRRQEHQKTKEAA